MKSTSEFLKFENLNFSNNLKWRNIQNKVVVHEKLWKFVVRNFFFCFKLYCLWKTIFESLKFETQILLTTLNGETLKNESCNLRKLWNFVVDNFLIWIVLKS
jgi:hypothetical protein